MEHIIRSVGKVKESEIIHDERYRHNLLIKWEREGRTVLMIQRYSY